MRAATTATPARSLAASTPARVLKVAVLLGLLVFVPPLVDNPYVTVCISALLFGLFGAVYDLMIGYAGLANFGYAEFIAAGAYGRRSPRSTTASAPGSAS